MRYKSKETMQEIVKCIEEFFFSYNRAPSISEIAKEIGHAKSMVYKYLIDMNEKGYIKYDGTVIGTPTTSKADTGYTLSPIVGSVSCGEPQYEEENFESYVALPDSLFGKEPHFILRASGTSMIEAGISPGDLVVVKKQNTANKGDTMAVLIHDTRKKSRAARFASLHTVRASSSPNSATASRLNLHTLTILP